MITLSDIKGFTLTLALAAIMGAAFILSQCNPFSLIVTGAVLLFVTMKYCPKY